MKIRLPAALAAPLIAAALLPAPAMAHCDGVDGPVVKLADQSLQTGNVNLVLPWVRADDEPAIRRVFDHAQAVRKLGPDAARLADRYFFETLVRIHRAGEGAPYTGLKPAGRDLGPAIPAADAALKTGSPAALEALLVDAVRERLHRQFDNARSQAAFDANDVAAGRRYVEAYVPYMHFVERVWEAAAPAAHGHAAAPEAHRH